MDTGRDAEGGEHESYSMAGAGCQGPVNVFDLSGQELCHATECSPKARIAWLMAICPYAREVRGI